MASFFTFVFSLSLLFSINLKACVASRILIQQTANSEYIKTKCGATTYPSLCYTSLSSYASTIQRSPMQLAHTSLSVTLDSARASSTALKGMCAAGGMSHGAAAAMKDCMDTMKQSVEELKGSMHAMDNMKGKNFAFQLNNIQTWVSAALTDDSTCMDEFSSRTMDGKLKTAVRSHVLNVAQMTSNSLALINAFVLSHSTSP